VPTHKPLCCAPTSPQSPLSPQSTDAHAHAHPHPHARSRLLTWPAITCYSPHVRIPQPRTTHFSPPSTLLFTSFGSCGCYKRRCERSVKGRICLFAEFHITSHRHRSSWIRQSMHRSLVSRSLPRYTHTIHVYRSICTLLFVQQAGVITKSMAGIAMCKSSPPISQPRLSQAHAQVSVEHDPMGGGNPSDMSKRIEE
jgi:hypothetical protein